MPPAQDSRKRHGNFMRTMVFIVVISLCLGTKRTQRFTWNSWRYGRNGMSVEIIDSYFVKTAFNLWKRKNLVKYHCENQIVSLFSKKILIQLVPEISSNAIDA